MMQSQRATAAVRMVRNLNSSGERQSAGIYKANNNNNNKKLKFTVTNLPNHLGNVIQTKDMLLVKLA